MNSSEYIEKERPFSLEVFRHTGHSGHLFFAAELPICSRNAETPYRYDAFVLLGRWSKGTLFHYLLYFFFLLTTVVPMAAPPGLTVPPGSFAVTV